MAIEQQPTIWMNVTTSANWQRPPVGIIRVERSLCAELQKLYEGRFKCCVWKDDFFVEYASDSCVEHIASTHVNAQTEDSVTKGRELPLIFPLLPRRQALIAVGQGLLSLAPGRLRPYVSRLLYQLKSPLVWLVSINWFSRVKARFRRQTTCPVSPLKVQSQPDQTGLLFAPGDVLISVGLDWDHPFYKEFYFLRKEQQIRVVTCCYDLIPVLYPQYCVGAVAGLFTSYFYEIADGSDLVLCISRQSEKDLLEMLNRTGGAKPKTHVFPLGDNVPVAKTEEISLAVKELCKETFILFVSTIERRKNHEVLYRAYHLLSQEGKRDELPKMLFVGMQGWGVGDLLKDIELDPLTRDLIVRLNHVTDAELRALYEAARFCVFPSLYEGWGLPVGEALSLGKPVLCSGRGSLPEVGGELVRYVDPWNPRAWADEIYRMANDGAWRSEWEQKAKAQYHVRTWTEAAISVQKAIQDNFQE
jgi:glycosyltransferase involved in cell wall biosynthesis